jgi:hypothetical protein
VELLEDHAVLGYLRFTVPAIMALGLTLPAAADGNKASEKTTCGEYGTSLTFEKTPSDAARKALKQEKLVFVLHVSGDFEDSEFT